VKCTRGHSNLSVNVAFLSTLWPGKRQNLLLSLAIDRCAPCAVPRSLRSPTRSARRRPHTVGLDLLRSTLRPLDPSHGEPHAAVSRSDCPLASPANSPVHLLVNNQSSNDSVDRPKQPAQWVNGDRSAHSSVSRGSLSIEVTLFPDSRSIDARIAPCRCVCCVCARMSCIRVCLVCAYVLYTRMPYVCVVCYVCKVFTVSRAEESDRWREDAAFRESDEHDSPEARDESESTRLAWISHVYEVVWREGRRASFES
jgi:hypothetical protein